MSWFRYKLRTLLISMLVMCLFVAVPRHVVHVLGLQKELSGLKSRDIVFYRDWTSATPELIGASINGRHCFFQDHCRFLWGPRELTVDATDTGIAVSIDGDPIDCQNVRINFDGSTTSFDDDMFYEKIGIDWELDERPEREASDSTRKLLDANLGDDPS